MIRIILTDHEAQALEQAFRRETDRKSSDRIQIVRLASQGRPHQPIAADLGISPRTVQRWLNAYRDRGLDGLRPCKAPGRQPSIPAHLGEEVRRWVIEGPAQQGLDRANWTHAERADHLFKTRGIAASRSAMQRSCRKLGIRPYRPTYRFLRGDPVKQAKAQEGLAELKGQAEAGQLVLLSQDEARFPMVPTLNSTLGVKGHRPTVGTRDTKDLLYVLGVVNVASGVLHANTLESPARAKRKTGKSKTRRLQEAFAAHLRHVGRLYPSPTHKRVVLIIDNAPWHAGVPVEQALAEPPHLELTRLPSSSPQLNVIERFWRVLRRRATHNRQFETLRDLKRSIRNSLGDFQTVRSRIKSMLEGRPKRKAKRTESAGL